MNVVRSIGLLSLLHGFALFLPVWMIANEGRLAAWIGWSSDAKGLVIFLAGCAISQFLTTYAYRLTKRAFQHRKIVFWTIGLWILPFYALFKGSSLLLQEGFPVGGFGPGFLIMGLVAGYPVYLLFFNVFATGVGIEEE